MKTLSETWFAEGYIDFELKKYTLLAYLQEVNKYFNESKLYPLLADMIFHYNNLVSLRENKKIIEEHFPKKLTGIQMEKLKVLYEQMIEDDDLMQELEAIINYSASTLKTCINSGVEIYELVEDKLTISPVGIIPLDIKEGYFFLNTTANKETLVFHYRLSFFEKHDEKYRSMKSTYVNSWSKNFVNSFESIKSELLHYRAQLPNPAVFSIESSLSLPVEETLLPIAKRSLVKYISAQAA